MGFGMREFEEFLQYLGFWLIGESGSHTGTITSASVCTVRVFAQPARITGKSVACALADALPSRAMAPRAVKIARKRAAFCHSATKGARRLLSDAG
jgi:hypothetical protein